MLSTRDEGFPIQTCGLLRKADINHSMPVLGLQWGLAQWFLRSCTKRGSWALGTADKSGLPCSLCAQLCLTNPTSTLGEQWVSPHCTPEISPGTAVTKRMALTPHSYFSVYSVLVHQSSEPVHPALSDQTLGHTEPGFTLGNLRAPPTGGGEGSVGRVSSYSPSSLGRKGAWRVRQESRPGPAGAIL